MSEAYDLQVFFPGVRPREAATLASDLRISLENAIADHQATAVIKLKKEFEDAMDVGTILAIVLGANATVAVAIGIRDWMRRRNQSSLILKDASGREVTITNAESEHLPKIIDKLYPSHGG